MFIKYLFLIFILFSSSLTAENPYLFQPNFSGQALTLPQGANIVPLCADPSNPICFNQWTGQALPLAGYFPSLPAPQYSYFIPSFVPTGLAENPEENEEWEEFYLPAVSSPSRRRRRSPRKSNNLSSKTKASAKEAQEDKKAAVSDSNNSSQAPQPPQKDKLPADSSKPAETKDKGKNEDSQNQNKEEPAVSLSPDSPKRKFYKSRSNPTQIRVVETSETGERTVQEGTIAFINVNDIQSSQDSAALTDSPSPDPAGSTEDRQLEAVQNQTDSNQKEPSQAPAITNKGFEPKSPPLDTAEANKNSQETQAPALSFQTARETTALPATTEEVQPGCFVINKQEELKTEAGFCAECVRHKENSPVLDTLIEDQNFVSSLTNYLKKVTRGAKNKIAKQTLISESDIEKICSPEISLKAVINNFNKTCPSPYKNNFKDFFKKAHCKSCQKGVPVELMMSMMSIESAGRCSAVAQNQLENSSGLFQVDGRQHQCLNEKGQVYNRRTQANLQCLKNPVNNLNKALDILVDHYGKTNSKPVSEGQCKNWMSLNPIERDSWRRGVSAYNGGPGWLTRAIKSARDQRTLKNTTYLFGTHRNRNLTEKSDTANWEELRAFYFIEKLSPANSKSRRLPECNSFLDRDHGGTGRQLCLTVSNLAHTEAVLGREVKGSVGMVEIWSQYKRKFLKKDPISCP